MGIYIKGMEMPQENEYIHLVIKNDGTVECMKSIFHINEPTTLIEMEQTTATEVPEPHGRLIDADKLLTDRMKSKYYHLPNGDTAIPIIDIEHAPTVIEGSE